MTAPEEPLRRKFEDAAHRISDTIRLHWTVNKDDVWQKWAAFSMHDGRGDNNLYDTAQEASRHQLHPEYCLFIHIMDAITPQEAQTLLDVHRQIYAAGYRSDPENPIVFGDGGNILRPLELKSWKTSGLIIPTHLRRGIVQQPNRETRRRRGTS